jgi:protoheme IX farnesyltransferase
MVPADVTQPALSGAAARPKDVRAFVQALLELSKPRITRMVLVTTAAGAAMAPGRITDWAKLGWAMLGTALIVASANALNMFLEGDVDALMSRTKTRPIPSGRLEPEVALWFGAGLAAMGLPLLDFLVNPATAFVGGFALLSYVLVYTPMKRFSPAAVWIGAIPGAAPPLMGWTAMTGALSAAAASVFLLMFVWQIPHFHAIAVFRMEEYQRAGLKVLPAEKGLFRTKVSIVGLLVLQLAVSALPAYFGLGGTPYIVAAAILGLSYLGFGIAGFRKDAGARWARTLFFASLPYLLVLFGVLVAFSD